MAISSNGRLKAGVPSLGVEPAVNVAAAAEEKGREHLGALSGSSWPGAHTAGPPKGPEAAWLPVGPILVHGHVQRAVSSSPISTTRDMRRLASGAMAGLGCSSIMLPLVPRQPERGGYEVLCLGANHQDQEIGCRGTMLRLLRELPIERVTRVVLSGDEGQAASSRTPLCRSRDSSSSSSEKLSRSRSELGDRNALR
jgi:hypothetical protein